MNDLGGANGGQVAIALVGNDDLVGTGALDGRGRGGRASVRRLHVSHIEVVIGKDGAAHGSNKNGAILQSHVCDGFGNQLMRDAMTASGTVVGLVLQIRFAFIEAVKDGRLRVQHLVTIGAGFEVVPEQFRIVCHRCLSPPGGRLSQQF